MDEEPGCPYLFDQLMLPDASVDNKKVPCSVVEEGPVTVITSPAAIVKP
jgi:hypothetical protein